MNTEHSPAGSRRFAPLHDIATNLLDKLGREFDVERSEGYDLDPELEGRCALARPAVALSPCDHHAARVVFAFTAFPGLIVRFGRWRMEAFPMCGCDACHETLEEEAKRLESMIGDLTSGRFRETLRIPVEGDAWVSSEFWSPVGRSSSGSMLDRDKATELLRSGDQLRYDWMPWTRRK